MSDASIGSTKLVNKFYINPTKRNFSTKYDILLRELSDVIQTEPSSQISNNRKTLSPISQNQEKHVLKPLNIEIDNNLINQHLFKTKFSILTGNTFDELNLTQPSTKVIANTSRNNTNNLMNSTNHSKSSSITTSVDISQIHNNARSAKALRDFRRFVKRKTEVSYTSKLLKNPKKKDFEVTRPNKEQNIEGNLMNPKINNGIIDKIKITFPEYMKEVNNGKSFIARSDLSENRQRISHLRNHISKI